EGGFYSRKLFRAAFGPLLLLERGGQAGHLLRGSVEQTSGLRQVALQRAGQLGQQDLAGLQVGDLLHLGDGQRGAVHVAALDDESLVVLREGLERLGRVDRLTRDEGDRGGTDEQIVQTLDARLGGRPLD